MKNGMAFAGSVLILLLLVGCAGVSRVRDEVKGGAQVQSVREAPKRQYVLKSEFAPEPVPPPLVELPEPIMLGTKEWRNMNDCLGAFVEMGHYFYLGANGELIAGNHDRRVEHGHNANVAVELQKRRIRFWVGWGPYPLANVDASGKITLETVTHRLVAGKRDDGSPDEWTATVSEELLPEFPTRWPYRDAQGDFVFPPSGTVLSRSLEQKVRVPDRPANCLGWLMLSMCDGLVAPMDGVQRPPNVLWVLPTGDGGYSLAHSGPLHEGTYAMVEAARSVLSPDSSVRPGLKEGAQVFYGKERCIFPTPNEFSKGLFLRGYRGEEMKGCSREKACWQAYGDENRATLAFLPPGSLVFPRDSEGLYFFMVVENGRFDKLVSLPKWVT